MQSRSGADALLIIEYDRDVGPIGLARNLFMPVLGTVAQTSLSIICGIFALPFSSMQTNRGEIICKKRCVPDHCSDIDDINQQM